MDERKYKEIKKIVDEHQRGKVDGVSVDAFTASMLLQICDNLNPQNREKFLSLPVHKMVDMGWKLSKKASISSKLKKIASSLRTK